MPRESTKKKLGGCKARVAWREASSGLSSPLPRRSKQRNQSWSSIKGEFGGLDSDLLTTKEIKQKRYRPIRKGAWSKLNAPTGFCLSKVVIPTLPPISEHRSVAKGLKEASSHYHRCLERWPNHRNLLLNACNCWRSRRRARCTAVS